MGSCLNLSDDEEIPQVRQDKQDTKVRQVRKDENIPFVQKLSQKETTSIIQEQKHEQKPSIRQEQSVQWTMNGLHSLTATLEESAASILPNPLILLISEYAHIGLLKPSNETVFGSETMRIDDSDGLLVHYVPDTDLSHYNNSWNKGRFDYIYCGDPVPSNDSIHFGNFIYFEVTLGILTEYIKDDTMNIAVGFRCQDIESRMRHEYKAINGGMLGWADNTIGIHSDDGNVFNEYITGMAQVEQRSKDMARMRMMLSVVDMILLNSMCFSPKMANLYIRKESYF